MRKGNIKECVQRDKLGTKKVIKTLEKQTYLPDFVAELMALSARLKPSADPGNKEEKKNHALAFVKF